MMLRLSFIRSLIILLITNFLIYIIFSRWFAPSYRAPPSKDNPDIYPPSLPRIKQKLSSEILFPHSPMHDELAQVYFDSIR